VPRFPRVVPDPTGMSPTDVEAAVSRRARLRALRDVLTSHESELQDALKADQAVPAQQLRLWAGADEDPAAQIAYALNTRGQSRRTTEKGERPARSKG
jgi:hypothetical protein